MMESWHVVGQKVVYFDGAYDARCIGVGAVFDPLSEGNIYTVSKVGIVYGEVCFEVEEWNDPFFCWCASRFRPVFPVVIESLRTLLTPTPDSIRELEEVG